jgi:chromosome partitioning protein
MSVVISIVNEKGGVGKTTTTISLGAAYAKGGRRTLVIDMDPQASLTRGLIGSVETDRLPVEASVAALFDENLFITPNQLIIPTGFENLFLLPGSRLLKPLNRLEPDGYGSRQYVLRELVNEVGERFDRILIDNPPNLEFCSWASMTASDYVVTPLQSEDYGAQGIQFVNQAVETIRAATNPRLLLLGYVRTMYQKRAAIHIAYSETIRQNFPGLLFENFIPHATQFREAVMVRKPMAFFKPRLEASKAVQRIVDEMEARIQQLTNPAVVDQQQRVA